MKYVLLSMVCVFFSLAGMAQEEGMRFENLSFEQALEKARAENKLVFVDCYTSWCGPCKRMMNSVFPQKEVGDYMNATFVNLKCDMEKGEGPELKERFRVAAFPTYVIVHPDGSIAHKFLGAMSASDFLACVKETFDEEKAFGTLEKKYEKGERDKEFLTRYGEVLRANSDSKALQVSHELFEQLTDEERFSEEYRYVYQRVDYFPVGSAEWKFFRDNEEKFREIMGDEGMKRIMFTNCNFVLNGLFADPEAVKSKRELKQIEKELATLPLDKDSMEILYVYLRVAQAKASGDSEKFVTVCEQELSKLPKGRIPMKAFQWYKEKGKIPAELQERWDNLEASIQKK